MKIEIKIPPLGESISEATVSSILKPSGSVVKVDEEILELETDKVNQVLYAPKAGKLTLTVKAEQVVKIGEVIGYVDTEAAGDTQEAAAPKKPAEKVPPPAPPKTEQGPSVRKMAADFVAEMKEGLPKQEPVKQAPQKEERSSSPSPSGQTTRKRMSSLRKMIAQKLVEVKNNTAMLTTFNEIDMSTVIEIRTKEKEAFEKHYNVRLGFMSFFIKGVVAALKAYPTINAMIDGEEIVTYHTYDIGVAVSTDKGLMVPVVRTCDLLSFAQIEASIAEFAKKARSGSISVDDLRGGSFTITNAGSFGSLLSTPILNPPQSAILGMHAIVKRAVVVNDAIVIRPMMYVALSYDHRIIDGREAVLFLMHLKQTLEDPTRLLIYD